MRISVFGLGYVGSVIAACMADQSHHVACYDIDFQKLNALRAGKSPIVEPGLSTLIQRNFESSRLTTCENPQQAVMNSDISFVCVGTPSKDDGSIDLCQILAACEQIGAAIMQKTARHTVVIRSTILPGTCDKDIIPCLERNSGKQAGRDFDLLVNPEFLREGSAINDYHNPPKIVIGVWGNSDPSTLETLYESFTCPKRTTSVKNAEAIKYVDNSWHALKVGFANEIGNILKDHDMDSHEVMDIFSLDTKLNISTAYLKPGFSFGGSCLPKDIRAISHQARKAGLNTPILTSLMQANEEQIIRALRMIKDSGRKNILLLGLAFKSHTDDLRSSPLLDLANKLKRDGYKLSVYDPDISRTPQKSFSMINNLVNNVDDLLPSMELVIVGNNNPAFADIIRNLPQDCLVLDLVRLEDSTLRERKNYAGICW